MGVVEDCEISPDQRDAAVSAAVWVQAFHPEVSVTLNLDVVTLASAERDAVGLRLIWRSALINEQLLARSGRRRAAVLESLLR